MGEGCDAQKTFLQYTSQWYCSANRIQRKKPKTPILCTLSTLGLDQYQLSLEKIQLLQKMMLKDVVLFQGLCKKKGKLVLLLSPFLSKKTTMGIFIFLSPSCSNLRKTVISLILILLLRSIMDVVKGLQYWDLTLISK